MSESKNILKENLNKKEINNILKNGGVIAFVTDTVWGIGCLPYNEKAIDKIYEIKGRDRTKPLILMSNNSKNLLPFIENKSNIISDLTKKYFPGDLTIVSKKSNKTSYSITSGMETVGIRVPDNEFFKYLCSIIEGNVLATTSANLSNQPASKTFEEAKNSIGNLVDIIFQDYGFKSKGIESTVVLIENKTNYKILRKGAIDFSL